MIFFMFKDLKKMFLSLLRIIVEGSVITGKTVQQLMDRSSHGRFSVRKGVLGNLAKFTANHLAQSLF